ncbi:related to archipelago beta form (F-box-WD40 repeat protein) [Serendipita indica DSM 11827]|uniref:Related to archipelago beta form (F-box-WD40 repeat protein) n=1 Tax=Serendipita indica (strain DSM 11827) TaxID=1109443 RepID=G4TSE7_SERID|nr:related to archipelago beta form (F-box-WD40 repeat protein) [Serendipita indica DSM 11827]
MSAETALNSKKQRGVMNPSASTSFAPASSSKRNQVYDIVNISLDVAANIAEGSDVLSPLKAACRTTKSILEVIQATENNQEEWNKLGLRLKEYMSALEDQVALFETYHGDGAVDKAFSQPLIHYVEFLEIMYDTVVDLKKKRSKTGIFTAFRKVKIDAGEILKLSRDIKDRHRQFMEALGLCTGIHVQAIKRDIKVTKGDMEVTKANVETILTEVDTAAILQLPIVAFVPSSVHRTCLEGTRKAVLQTIWQWADDKTSEKPIFWLCDIAGSGKSTVAMSAVEKWRGEGVLGGRFFFSIASNEGSTTDKFCSTIARDLVQYIPELAPHVAGAVKRNPSVIRSSIDEQFQTLVVYPICHQQRRVILVIDALDECRSGPQRRELVDTLSTAVRQNKNLRIFMTSRPDPVVQAVLGSLSIKAKLEDRLHDVRHRDNVDDIAVYVYQSLDDILSEDKKQRLVKKANGLFIWASTACRMLNSETSLSPPGIIYNRLMSMGQAGAMDDLYTLIFERTDPEYHAVMYQMLALLLAAFEPLTSDDLDDILKHAGVEGSAKAFVRNLGSVLTEDRTTKLIQFRHPTLVEFLRRCSITQGVDGHQKLHINIANAHGSTYVKSSHLST